MGVAAGFAPLAIGTETAGSTVFPASVNGIYALKLAKGSVPVDGVFKLSDSFDCIGLLARDAQDLASLATVLLDQEAGVLTPSTKKGFEGLSIGLVDANWGINQKFSGGKWSLPSVVRSSGSPSA